MGNFFRENWIWILAPVVLLGLLLVLAMFVGDGTAPFQYALF